MKIVSVVGARPQFVKAAAVSRVLRSQHDEIMIHTGQHYDPNMSECFFEELHIPVPNYNLGVGSGTHAKQTAQMMIGIEEILLKEKPDAVLLYGDTNSTLAGAITAAKLGIPIAHVEAGVRCGKMDMPEEQNRICTDHLSTWLFAPSQSAMHYLEREGLSDRAYLVGDVMYDAMLYYGQQADNRQFAEQLQSLQVLDKREQMDLSKYYLATTHRPENVDHPDTLRQILEALNELDHPVIYAIHPRTQAKCSAFGIHYADYQNILFVAPLGYIEMIYFTKHACKVITDSGGLHKEAYLWKVPGVVILRDSAWGETLEGNWNVLARPNKQDILQKALYTEIDQSKWAMHYGDGHASEKITQLLR